MLRFIHISDTHIGPTKDFCALGINTWDAAKKLVLAINNSDHNASFIIHTGDVAYDPDENAYNLASELFGTLKLPIYYISGNHDDPKMLKNIFTSNDTTHILPDEGRINFYFENSGEIFLCLDAVAATNSWCGEVTQPQIKFVNNFLDSQSKPVSIFLHYPPIQMDSVILNSRMKLNNGDQFHEILVAHKNKIRAVFFGHIHQDITIVRDGILYSGQASSCWRFSGYPHESELNKADISAPSFNLISYDAKSIIIKPILC
jgi:3',5'-cyclic-AMP phosphodiesterase